MNSSGSGWETVGASNKAGKQRGSTNGNAKARSKGSKQPPQSKGPKLEDVLPLEQLTNAYLVGEGRTPPESPKVKTGKKKPSTATANNASKKRDGGQGDVAKKTLPATLEEAVKKVSPTELKTVLATVKSQYPQNEFLWIRDAGSYFNVNLNSETPVDLSNPFSNSPLSLLTKETRRVLIALYEDCSEAARESSYETLMANMAHDMAKGLCPNGYVVMLQSLLEVYPSLSVQNSRRFHELLRSYQNRPNIGVALLWAVGQGGRKDLAIGIKAWTDFIAALLSFKHYSRFVVDYLVGLLEHHKAKIASNNVRVVYAVQFFKIFDIVYGNNSNMNKQLMAKLLDQYSIIKSISIGDCSSDQELFPEFLRRLPTQTSDSDFSSFREEEILVCLTNCLKNSEAALAHWQQMYTSYLAASAMLLSDIDKNWSTVWPDLKVRKGFPEVLEAFQEHNETASGQKEGIPLASAAIQSLLMKMNKSQSSGGRGWFPWKTTTILLVVLCWYLVDQDIKSNGGFRKSKTGIFLKDVGLDELALSYYESASLKYAEGHAWAERNLPVAKAKLDVAVMQLGLYWQKALASLAWTYNWLVQKLETYVPGAQEKISVYALEARRLLLLAFDKLSLFISVAASFLVEWFKAVSVLLTQTYDRLARSNDKMSDAYAIAQEAAHWTSVKAQSLSQWVTGGGTTKP